MGPSLPSVKESTGPVARLKAGKSLIGRSLFKRQKAGSLVPEEQLKIARQFIAGG
jgi:hypothetical protein